MRATLYLGAIGLVFSGLFSSWSQADSASIVLAVSEAQQDEQSKEKSAEQELARRGRAILAMCSAITTNANYCQDWLDADDFESLKKTARGLALLKDLLLAESEDADWQSNVGSLGKEIALLLSAADESDKDVCGEIIAKLKTHGESLAAMTPELKASPAYSSRNDIGRIMDLLDGTYADAKVALTFGDVDVAQREAFVLWRIGEYLRGQQARGTSADKWHALADAFSAAALTAAELPDPGEPQLRESLKIAREQCENCHNRD